MGAKLALSGDAKLNGAAMRLPDDQLQRLALHSAFGLHLIAKWMAGRSDVDPEIRDRLSVHIAALDGVLSANGHDWIKDEIEGTEAALQGR
ncbi:MAG: hypothetical protein K0Q62_1859 [Phenylobacterium sp.]|jgi:hypothetical protein|nr:hypothetical protein [Phenylobacterium sp.]